MYEKNKTINAKSTKTKQKKQKTFSTPKIIDKQKGLSKPLDVKDDVELNPNGNRYVEFYRTNH